MEKRLFLTFICWRWESRKVSLSSHLKSRCKVSTYKPIGVQCAACFSLIWKFGASSAQTMRVDFSSTRLFFLSSFNNKKKYSLIFLKSTFFSAREGANVILRFCVTTHWPFCKKTNILDSNFSYKYSLEIYKINQSVYLEALAYFKAGYVMMSSWKTFNAIFDLISMEAHFHPFIKKYT